QNLEHIHPLVFNEEQSNETKKAKCSRCGEVVSDPSFSCGECEFSLHKKCAEAPSKIDRPYHHHHPLVLLPESPYVGSCYCDFCYKKCDFFVYHCSCGLDFHIKCALFTLSIAEQKLQELNHIATKDPSVFLEEGNKELENAKCFGCWLPLGESRYFSVACGFNLHIKCAELPHEINHPFHKEHPLVLQFNIKRFSCKICEETRPRGFLYCCSACSFALHIKCAQQPTKINHLSHRRHPLVLQLNSGNLLCKTCQETQHEKFVYCCSTCNFSLHTECAFLPPIVKDKNHQHPFTLFQGQPSFVCNACGLEGNYIAYICSTCNLMIHTKCISIPLIIGVRRHYHPIYHNYFISENESKIRDCSFCDVEVNIDYGSYYCLRCNFIAHVKCATKYRDRYYIIEAKDIAGNHDDDLGVNPITCVIEQNESGEMTRIKHFSHAHDLILSDNVMENDITCDGCMLLILDSFYCCTLQCNFFHKVCGKSPRKKHLWFHGCQELHILVVGYLFKCSICEYDCGGFSYKCNKFNVHICLQCSVIDYRTKHPGHQHPILYNRNQHGRCNGCGETWRSQFSCKHCDFNLDFDCSRLRLTTRHKRHEHPLALAYQEGNDYPKYHYCDLCEKERDPNLWFYHCAICEFSAHPNCVLAIYMFIKPGSMYKGKGHPHPLTFVWKPYRYIVCCKCSKPCKDLVFECAELTCNYIVH
ncbi:hypothetical protein ERO13_A09G225300v2, partial [Gossypium hirsutum]